MWAFFHKLGSPKWFYGIAGRFMPWLLVSGLLLLGVGVVWGLAFAPQDYLQGNSYRIIFIHVPTAFLAQSVYVMMAAAGVITLVWRMKLADVFVKAVAPVGAVLTFLALFTGAVWGKPTWGTWWIWDARLTSMLILLFLYFGVIALGNAIAGRKIGGPGGCRADAGGCGEHPHHQVFGRVVEHAAPAGHFQVNGKAQHACRDVGTVIAVGAGALSHLRLVGLPAHADGDPAPGATGALGQGTGKRITGKRTVEATR